jgi:hypothetical protein
MQAELRKLAIALREQAKAQKKQKRVKCAQVLQALTALELLRRKIGG